MSEIKINKEAIDDICNRNIPPVVDFKEYISTIKSRMTTLNNELSKCNATLENLYHAIENDDNHNIVDGYNLYKEMREIRRKRRIIKNEIILIEPICNFINDNFNIINKFNVLSSEINSKMNYLYNPKYNKRKY